MKLEKELLELAYNIHFCDSQIEAYSIKIAELILRCAAEIESISKALYQNEGGNMNPVDDEGKERYLNYDFDCLKLLDQLWGLSKKKIILSTPSMYFEKEENIGFKPLKNAHKGDASWQKAYQAIKHSRVENMHKANIRVLIRIMGALYILNLYYQNDFMELNELDKFNPSQGSDIFMVSYGDINNKEELEKYIVTITEDLKDYSNKLEQWANEAPLELHELLKYEMENPSPKRYRIALNKHNHKNNL